MTFEREISVEHHRRPKQKQTIATERLRQTAENATAVYAVLLTVHLCLALARGGTLGCFFRPLKNVLWLRRRVRELGVGVAWRAADERLRACVRQARLGHLFSLGLRGLLGGLAWLVPATMLFTTSMNIAVLPST